MERLLFAAVLGFGVGVLVLSFLAIPWPAIACVAVIGTVFLTLYLLKKASLYLLVGIFLLAAALGMVRTMVQPSVLPEALRPLIGQTIDIEGTVVVDPDIRESTQRLTVEVEEGDKTVRILVVAPPYPAVAYGDTVRAEGTLEVPEPFDTTEGRVFRYDKFLAKDGVFLIMQKSSLGILAPRSGLWHTARGVLSEFKFNGIRALAVALPEPYASLAGGLILGGKQGLGTELLNDFIRTGLVHIVVLSGYNVMIVADAVYRVFGFLSRQSAAIAAGVTILAFVLSAGAGAASARAGIMAAIALYGRASGRTYDAFRALILAGLLMVLWNPLTLAFDPGFQLSFIATIGLIFGAPITERWFSFVKIMVLKEILASTIAAQISVLPLLLYQNGLFSVVALPANIVVLPIVPIAMLASAVAGVAGALLPAAAPIFAFPAYLLLSYITSVVEFAADLPFAAFTLPAFPFWVVIVSYVLLGWGTLRATRPPLENASQRRPS